MILERFSSLIATAIPRLKTWFPLLECRTKKEKKKKRITVRVTKEEKEKKKKTEEWRDAESGKDRKKQDCNLCRFLFGELYQVAICLIDSYPLSFLLLALLAFFFTLCLLVGSSRPCQEENRPRHAICESYSHAFTAFRRRKKKKVLHGHLDNRRKNYADNRRTRWSPIRSQHDALHSFQPSIRRSAFDLIRRVAFHEPFQHDWNFYSSRYVCFDSCPRSKNVAEK